MTRYASRPAVVLLLTVLSFTVTSCWREAEKAIDAAEVALKDAKKADADEYAPVEYQSAEDSLAAARDHYDYSRYQKAREEAEKSQDMSRLAHQKALEEKARTDEETRKARMEQLAVMNTYNPSSLFDEDVPRPPDKNALLKDVYFGVDSEVLSAEAQSTLSEVAAWLRANDFVKIEIEGHCDERGTEEYNQALGAKRAQTVKSYLVSLGVPSSRLRTISYGESVPKDPGHDEAAWARNRRAHFAILR